MTEHTLPDIIRTSINDAIRALSDVYDNNKYTHSVHDIDCSNLPDPVWKKGEDIPPSLQPFLEKLPARDRPCLYHYELISPAPRVILEAYRSFRTDIKYKTRSTATLKKSPPLDTFTLYVGKVKKDMAGRTMVHLGYYYVGGTAGLQLVLWAKALKMKLRLHVFTFEKEMHSSISSLELPYARHLRPLIGKH